MVEINNYVNTFSAEGVVYSEIFSNRNYAIIRNKGVSTECFTRTQMNGNIVSTSGSGGWGSASAPGAGAVWLGFCT